MVLGGNIILTNQNYEILALLRSYKLDDSVDIQVGNVFSIPQQEADAVTATGNLLVPVFARSIPEFKAWIREKELEYLCKEAAALDSGTGGKKVKAKKFTVRQLLLSKDSGVASFGSEILEHCILASGLDANTKVETILSPEFSDSALENLLHEIGNGAALMTDLDRPLKPGYIVYKPFSQSDERLEEKDMEFLEFLPKLFKQHESKLSFEVSSFHEAVDRYFCKFEEQKLEKIAKAAEEAAQKKVAPHIDPRSNRFVHCHLMEIMLLLRLIKLLVISIKILLLWRRSKITWRCVCFLLVIDYSVYNFFKCNFWIVF